MPKTTHNPTLYTATIQPGRVVPVLNSPTLREGESLQVLPTPFWLRRQQQGDVVLTAVSQRKPSARAKLAKPNAG